MNEELLTLLNSYTRRNHTADEVYLFDVILCDNEVDRDMERFTLDSLNKLKELFVGKTGIFDHNPKGENQTARIFSTEIISDVEKVTSQGEPYTCLKAHAYMIRTKSNEDLIKEIDGGIKKEVSVSCMAERKTCSVCGADLTRKTCRHQKGQTYDGKRCHVLLDRITDAYEWSFVAVPAQINAGITKFFAGEAREQAVSPERELLDRVYEETKAEIVRMNFLTGEILPKRALNAVLERMDLAELTALKKSFRRKLPEKNLPQMSGEKPDDGGKLSAFRIGKGDL